jgi:predicted O-methyltransferase YrrM
MPLSELYLLSALVRKIGARNIFEIGTFEGRTALHLALNSEEQARVYTLDLPASMANQTQYRLPEDDIEFMDKPEIGGRYRGTHVESKITQLHGDSATFDFSSYFGMMDFVLVDGCRMYEYVMSDA